MHGRRQYGASGFPGLTPMVKRIMIVTGVIWVAQQFSPGLTDIGVIRTSDFFSRGYVWQPFTYMWLHDPRGIMHIFFNMFALWMFGGQLEQIWGGRRFLRFYLICGVGAGLVILLWNGLTGNYAVPTLGASGAVYGILMAFSLTWPDRTIMLLFPPIPIKAIWFIPVLFVLQVAFGGASISHAGHLGGVLVAAVLLRRDLRSYFGRSLSSSSLRYRWHRYRMRGRLRAVRREEWEKRRKSDEDDDRPTYH